jgi:hypothetical protein
MTEPMLDGTPHVPRVGEYRPPLNWCEQRVCLQGQPAIAVDPNHRPADTECTRYTCNERKLVTERLAACPMTDSGVDADADGDVTDSDSDSGVDGELGDALGADAVDAGGD